MAMDSGVYQVRNTNNDKIYIGGSRCLKDRKYSHFRDLCNGNHANTNLQNDYILYGANSFVFEVLQNCHPDNIIETEQIFINALRPEYNICQHAGSRLGQNNSEKQKEAVSKANKNKPKSAETKRKISETKKGIKISDETRIKYTKLKNAAKKIICNETKIVYNSSKEAADFYKVKRTCIANILTGRARMLSKYKVSFSYYKKALIQSL